MMDSGTGYIFLDILVVVLCAIAAIFQLAVMRDASVPEPRLVAAARGALVAGYAILAVRFCAILMMDGDLRIPGITEIAMSMVAAGHIAFAWGRLKGT
jgi:hypothetical protein